MKYAISKSTRLQVSDKREIVAANSVSRRPRVLSPHVMFVFLFFLEPKTMEEALAELQEYFDFQESDFKEAVSILIEQNILTPIDQEEEAPSLAEKGFASLVSHHHMLRDTLRVLTYKSAISKHVAGKSVLEIGCGTGILSIFAAKAGAGKVIAIEESKIADLAREMFEANAYSNIIELKYGNSKDIRIEECVDVIIHEILGTDPIEENILPFIDDARRRFLKKGGRMLPFRLEICCRGITADSSDEALFEASELASIYGLNMTPYLEALKKQKRNQFGALNLHRPEVLKNKILSEECVLYDIDFYKEQEDLYQPIQRNLIFLKAGHFSGVVIYFRAHLDETTVLTNSPLAAQTHWNYVIRSLDKTVLVNQGDLVGISASIKTQKDGLDRIKVELSDMGRE